jgi:PAP2 superfamily protein
MDHASVMFISVLTSIRRRPILIVLAIALPIIECLARRSGGPGPSIAILRNPFATIAVASVFCRYVIYDRQGRSRKWIVYLTPATVLPGLIIEGPHVPMPLVLLDMLFALGVLGAFGFLLAACRASDRQERMRYLGQLGDALILPMGASLASFGLWSTYRLNPVYDGRVYAFEEILGLQFSVLGVRTYHLLAPLSAAATACYGTVALAIVLVAAAQRRPDGEAEVLTAMVVAGASGFVLYFICPVVGPLNAFGPPYPDALPMILRDAPLIVAPLGHPRNGMPSLHTVWALLIWFNAQSVRPSWRWGFRLFVVMTFWAVMGLDDTHWLMDMVVAVPLAVALQSAIVSRPLEDAGQKWTTVACCLALTAAWLIGLRASTLLLRLPAAGAWTAVVATVWWPLSRQLGADLAGGADRARSSATRFMYAAIPIRDLFHRDRPADGN